MTTVTEPKHRIIGTPGMYDIPEDVYFADPVPGGSLSNSGAKDLLPPSCPAIYRYKADHPGEVHKRHFDFGSAAHKRILGSGPKIHIIEAPNYKTKLAQEEQKKAYAAGEIPVLRHEYEQVQEMAAAIKAHPLAGPVFNPALGVAEQSLFWVDEETGVWRRSRLDWLRRSPGLRTLVVDYKTTDSLDPEHLSKILYNFGYFRQAPFYLDGVRAVFGEDAGFLFVAQMKTPPYLVTVFDLDPDDMTLGRELNRQATEIFRDCQASGVWPEFSDPNTVSRVQLPTWVRRKHEVAEW